MDKNKKIALLQKQLTYEKNQEKQKQLVKEIENIEIAQRNNSPYDFGNRVIDEFNKIMGSKYSKKNEESIRLIQARANEMDSELDDEIKLNNFRLVIIKKYNDWIGDDGKRHLLKPTILFGDSFEGYLNEILQLEKYNEYEKSEFYKERLKFFIKEEETLNQFKTTTKGIEMIKYFQWTNHQLDTIYGNIDLWNKYIEKFIEYLKDRLKKNKDVH